MLKFALVLAAGLIATPALAQEAAPDPAAPPTTVIPDVISPDPTAPDVEAPEPLTPAPLPAEPGATDGEPTSEPAPTLPQDTPVEAEEAAEFYTSIFPDSRVDGVWTLPTDSPSGPAGAVRVVDFTLFGQRFQAMTAGPHHEFNDAISIVVPCHRVVNKNGDLGGYGGGLWRKRRLLHLEGQSKTLEF